MGIVENIVAEGTERQSYLPEPMKQIRYQARTGSQDFWPSSRGIYFTVYIRDTKERTLQLYKWEKDPNRIRMIPTEGGTEEGWRFVELDWF